jgi:hypothetical protein
LGGGVDLDARLEGSSLGHAGKNQEVRSKKQEARRKKSGARIQKEGTRIKNQGARIKKPEARSRKGEVPREPCTCPLADLAPRSH